MNLIWLGDRFIATTAGDLFVGLVFLALAAAAGAHAWHGQVAAPILALYGIAGAFLVPIGLWLVLRYRHLVLDFSTNTYSFRDGLLGRGRSKAGDMAEIAALKVRIEERIVGAAFVSDVEEDPGRYTKVDVTISIRDLLPDGLELTCCNESRATRLIERLTSRFAFTVQREVDALD